MLRIQPRAGFCLLHPRGAVIGSFPDLNDLSGNYNPFKWILIFCKEIRTLIKPYGSFSETLVIFCYAELKSLPCIALPTALECRTGRQHRRSKYQFSILVSIHFFLYELREFDSMSRPFNLVISIFALMCDFVLKTWDN